MLCCCVWSPFKTNGRTLAFFSSSCDLLRQQIGRTDRLLIYIFTIFSLSLPLQRLASFSAGRLLFCVLALSSRSSSWQFATCGINKVRKCVKVHLVKTGFFFFQETKLFFSSIQLNFIIWFSAEIKSSFFLCEVMKKKKKKKVHKRKGLVSAFPPWPSSSRKQNMPSPRQQTESWCRCRTRRSFSGILRSVWTPAVAPPSAHWMTHNFFVRPQFLENHLKNSFCTAFKLERATLHLMIFMCGVQNTSGSLPPPIDPWDCLKASRQVYFQISGTTMLLIVVALQHV